MMRKKRQYRRNMQRNLPARALLLSDMYISAYGSNKVSLRVRVRRDVD